jgi:hypothetical protein
VAESLKDMWLDGEVNGGKGKRDEGVFVIDEGYWWAKSGGEEDGGSVNGCRGIFLQGITHCSRGEVTSWSLEN